MSESTKKPEQAEENKAKTAPAEDTKKAEKKASKSSKKNAQADRIAELEKELEKAQQSVKESADNFLRLAAEYDNFRKRSQREKDNLYTDIRAETVGKFLPVYDNLERALKQETADDAFKKGVEMTMTQLTGVFEKLGVTAFGEAGESFDPAEHNAVMHCEDENAGENTIVEVFQKGFRMGDKIIRFAMVKVAN
mgnify:CR=1 FL=1